MAGSVPRSHAAPGPHAYASTRLPGSGWLAEAAGLAESAGLAGSTRIVPGPSGVRDVRHTAPVASNWKVGSPAPLPWGDSVSTTWTANAARHSRTRPPSADVADHDRGSLRGL